MRARVTVKSVVVAVAVLLLLHGAAASASWSAGKSSTRSAPGGDTAGLAAVQETTLVAMGPGDAPQTISGRFDNPHHRPAYVSAVTASIDSVIKAVDAPAGTCDATDYLLLDPVIDVGAAVPAGRAQGHWSGASLRFRNKVSVNQDACKGATVHLTYTVS